MKRQVLFTDAVIHTGRTEEETFSAMLVQDGRIVRLYDTPPQLAGVETVRLSGKHVYPCLIDAHTHLQSTVMHAAAGYDLCRIEGGAVVPSTMKGVEDALRAYAKTKKRDEIVIANNYILSAIDERRLPTRTELDAWTDGRAVAVYTIDEHASALSTAMLQKVGIDPTGHSGLLDGHAHEDIQGEMMRLTAKAVTLPAVARGLAAFENTCAGYGISHVGALEGSGDGSSDRPTRLFVTLMRRMQVQARLYLQYIRIENAGKYRKFQKTPRIGGCGEWEMDGAVGSHTAAFSTPYRDRKNVAGCYFEQDFVNGRVRQAIDEGYQISSHAIGTLAIDRILTAIERTGTTRLHRIEHGEFATSDMIKRYADAGVAVVMQPGYSWIDKRFLHTYEQHLEPELVAMLRFRSLLDAGVCVCGSSDSPVQTLDPYIQMMGMTEFYHENESITAYQAFCCYTKNPARALGEENEIGTLEAGKEANFFTADADLFTLTPAQIGAFRPTATYYGGKKYRARRGTVGELVALLLRKPHQI